MYKNTFNQLIHEELTISGEVQQEVLNVWKEIETCVPDIKTEDYTDYDYKSHNEKTLLLKSKNVFMQNIVKHFQNATLYFENQQIKHAILDLLHRTNRFL